VFTVEKIAPPNNVHVFTLSFPSHLLVNKLEHLKISGLDMNVVKQIYCHL
jgi:hypothetical protein